MWLTSKLVVCTSNKIIKTVENLSFHVWYKARYTSIMGKTTIVSQQLEEGQSIIKFVVSNTPKRQHLSFVVAKVESAQHKDV